VGEKEKRNKTAHQLASMYRKERGRKSPSTNRDDLGKKGKREGREEHPVGEMRREEVDLSPATKS